MIKAEVTSNPWLRCPFPASRTRAPLRRDDLRNATHGSFFVIAEPALLFFYLLVFLQFLFNFMLVCPCHWAVVTKQLFPGFNSLLDFWIWISVSPGFGDDKIDLSCLISNLCYLPINCDNACILYPSCVCFKVSANVCAVFPRWLIGVEPRSRIMLFGIPSKFSTYSVMGIKPRGRLLSLEMF